MTVLVELMKVRLCCMFI